MPCIERVSLIWWDRLTVSTQRCRRFPYIGKQKSENGRKFRCLWNALPEACRARGVDAIPIIPLKTIIKMGGVRAVKGDDDTTADTAYEVLEAEQTDAQRTDPKQKDAHQTEAQ
jgi:hypothetical protein